MHELEIKRAVAYYRCAAENKHENKIAMQRNAVHEYARKYGIQIIHELTDSGQSGRTIDRPGFQSLLLDWILNQFAPEFDYVFMTDISRLGRFDNCNEHAYYEYLCHKNNKAIVYVSGGEDPHTQSYQKMRKALVSGYDSRLAHRQSQLSESVSKSQ